jgi:hypothetical protein
MGGEVKRRRLRESLAVISAVSILLSASTHAATGGGQGSGEGRGYLMLGASMMDLNDFNERLQERGYPIFSDHLFSVGGGGHAIINGIVLGGEGHGFITRETTRGGEKVSFACGYGFFDLGYLVYSAGGLHVYPLLGLGGGTMSLKIVESGTPSFDDVLDDPGRTAELVTGGLLVNVAIGSDYLLKIGADEEGEGGFVFGLRAGYTFSPIKGDWQMEGEAVSGGPNLSITGPYVHLMIGAGAN